MHGSSLRLLQFFSAFSGNVLANLTVNIRTRTKNLFLHAYGAFISVSIFNCVVSCFKNNNLFWQVD